MKNGKETLPIEEIMQRIDELAADVEAHDETLRRMLKNGARGGTFDATEAREQPVEDRLALVDNAGAVIDRLSAPERSVVDGILRLAFDKRQLIASFLSLETDERRAIAYVIGLSDQERRSLGDAARAAEQEADGTP